jgi:hypothetical protein
VIQVSEDTPRGTPDGPHGAAADSSRDDVTLADGRRLAGTIGGRLADQARRTASAARAGRVMNGEDEPGVLDLTPLRELLSELVEELRELRPRVRIA